MPLDAENSFEPEKAEEEVKDAEPEVTTDTSEEKIEDENGKDEEPKKEVEEKTGFQRRIDNLTAERRKLERENSLLLEALAKNNGTEKKPEEEAEPETFPTVEAYIDHMVEKKMKAGMKNVEVNAAQIRQDAIQDLKVQTFQQKAEAFSKNHPDFYELINDPSIPSSTSIAQSIIESDNGPEVAFYLAKNNAEYMKIINLSPIQQVIAVGKISAKIEAGGLKIATSKAPTPLNTLKGGNANVGTGPKDSMSISEWMAAEQKRMSKSGR